jgi:hypothetical protein
MALSQGLLDALFARALEDTPLACPAVLVPLRGRPASWRADQEAKLILPGDAAFTWRDAAEPELREFANSRRDAHRVVMLSDDSIDEPTALGLMRWCLEVARQWEQGEAIHDFGLFISRAIERTYAGTGLGGASVYNRIPTMRDANAAAAELVNATFDPVPAAAYFGNHGSLRRPIGPPEPETLAARLVVFAFQHRRDVMAQAEAEGCSLDERLTPLDPAAPLWWSLLTRDAALARSTDKATSLIPDETEIEAVDPPIRAWWPLLTRLDHDHDHGLALIEHVQ